MRVVFLPVFAIWWQLAHGVAAAAAGPSDALSAKQLEGGATHNDVNFSIAVLAPLTSVSQGFLGVAAAFDLDFRKNFDSELVGRFGPPVVHIPDLHPALRVSLNTGTSNSDPVLAMDTFWDWLTSSETSAISGVVGGYHSAVSVPIASVAGTRRLPQVSFASTSPVLSDKSQYPYFLRTISSDSVQGAAMYAWMRHFDVQSVAFVYTNEPYGQGLFQTTASIASEAGLADVHGVPLPAGYALEEALQASSAIQATGSKFVLLAVAGGGATVLVAMEQDGLLYGSHQMLAAEAIILRSSDVYTPSLGLPVGWHQLQPVSRGSLAAELEAMWMLMTPEDVYGDSARQRYGIDRWLVPLGNSTAPQLTSADFTTLSGLDTYGLFMFDAFYAFVFAANTLLQAGAEPSDIRGPRLLQALQNITFEGVTGVVQFNEAGDRPASFLLYNAWPESDLSDVPPTDMLLTQSGQSLVRVGLYTSDTDQLTLTVDPLWAPNGERLPSPPSVLFDCSLGFQRDTTTGLCSPCVKGIGCGYREADGIPIGIMLPITSAGHEYLAAIVAADLDLRKNFDAELRERFGPPIINISSIHPDLRLKLQVGTSDSQSRVSLNTALDWFLGSGRFSRVAAIAYGYFSSITIPVAANAVAFETPMMGFGATSPRLSDKSAYPFFSRVIAADTLQGKAIWVWMQSFNVPSVVFFYTRDAYGEGLFQSTTDVASQMGGAHLLLAVSIRAMHNDESRDIDATFLACRSVKEAGSRFVVFGMIAVEFTPALYVMEQLGILYGRGAFQLLGAEAVYIDETTSLKPSLGLPLGFQKLLPASEGALTSRWEDLWRKLTPEDIYSEEARSRYLLDFMRVKLSEGASPFLNATAFQSKPLRDKLLPFVFDGFYAFAIAINNLLHRGVPPAEIYGQRLNEEVRQTSFEGISGEVLLDENGDRLGTYELWNWRFSGSGGSPVPVLYGSTDISITTFVPASQDDGLVWASGDVGLEPPAIPFYECEPGFGWASLQGRCVICPTGWFSQGGGRVECAPCAPGWKSEVVAGAVQCVQCEPGTFKGLQGNNCTLCREGSFSDAAGASACRDCSVGSFASSEGLTECERCGAGRPSEAMFTTMGRLVVQGQNQSTYISGSASPTDCGCDRGFRQTSSGECTACTEGVTCPGLDVVLIEQGYYSEETLSVYRCHGDSRRCVGGVPGETCAPGRYGITCSECEDGRTAAAGGECLPCAGADQAPFFIFLLVSLLLIVGMYEISVMNASSSKNLSLIFCAIAVGQCMTAMQQLSVVAMLDVEWVDPFLGFVEILTILTLDLEILNFNCISSVRPQTRYVFKLSVIPISITCMCIQHCLHVLLFYKRKMRNRRWSLIAAVSTLLMVFYIAVTTVVLEPLQCKEHPNGKWTVQSYQAIVCWESSEHFYMLAIGAVAFLAVPVGFLVAVVTVVVQFPRRLQASDARFIRAFSFLFFRFKPGRQNYIVVHMVRSLILAACIIIPKKMLAVLAMEVVMFVSFALTLILTPWRLQAANIADAILGAAMVFAVSLCGFFLHDDELHKQTLSWICLVAAISSFSVLPAALTLAVWKKLVRKQRPYEFFLCHHKAHSGAFARLLKMYLVEIPKSKGDCFIDSDNLDNLDHLFDYVRSETQRFVILASSEICLRQWCMGEMTAARTGHVPTILVQLPACVLPNAEFIAGFLNHQPMDMEVLTESGLDMAVIVSTLHWVAALPPVQVPKEVGRDVMVELVTALRSASLPEIPMYVQAHIRGAESSTAVGAERCYLAYDTSNFEAAAASHVLQKMLTAISDGIVPQLVDDEEFLPSISARMPSAMLLVMCTNGAFENAPLLEILLKARGYIPSPVIGEATFRFPPHDVVPWLRRLNLPTIRDLDMPAIGISIVALFKEIAATFQPHHASHFVLEVNAREINRRIYLHMRQPGPDASSSKRYSTDRGVSSRGSIFSLVAKLKSDRSGHSGTKMSPVFVEDATHHDDHEKGNVGSPTTEPDDIDSPHGRDGRIITEGRMEEFCIDFDSSKDSVVYIDNKASTGSEPDSVQLSPKAVTVWNTINI